MFYLKSTEVTLIFFFFFNYENQSAKVESSSRCVFFLQTDRISADQSCTRVHKGCRDA